MALSIVSQELLDDDSKAVLNILVPLAFFAWDDLLI